jgi:hypothetical protein
VGFETGNARSHSLENLLCKRLWTSRKTWVGGRSLAGIVASNPAGGMDVCCCVCCQVEVSASG